MSLNNLEKVTYKDHSQDLSIKKFILALKEYQPHNFYIDGEYPTRHAAILIPLFCMDCVWHVLFTRRTDTVQDHKGQVSFPGGVMEPQDMDLVTTALREADEEIGLKPENVLVVGKLGEMQTVSGYLITPIVSVIPWPYPFITSPEEVSRIFSIPLEWLAESSHHEERTVTLGDKIIEGVVFFQNYDGELLWGLTARITLELLHAVKLLSND